QTVDRDRHGLFYRVIKDFEALTGCPVVVNTSFNLGWDPMVCAPKEAYQTFMQSGIDALCIGRHLLIKSEQPAKRAARSMPGADPILADLLRSPCHQVRLVAEGEQLRCEECGRRFGSDDGIRQMYIPHQQASGRDVTDEVKSFYEEIPFPNYDDHDTLRSLIDKSRAGVYARKLDEAIPFNSTVLEVGCGTGQLTNFLGISCRRAIGTDLCLNSLRLAENFRRTHGLEQVRFLQMNLFRPCFAQESFDVVLCNGVLHHTGDPLGGFRSLVPLVRPGGFVVVGLYNTFGRLMTDARRQLFRLTRGRLSWIDPFLRSRALSADKRRAWMADQYFHPHESKHSMGEILGWIDAAGLEFVRGIPSLDPRVDALATDDLFDSTQRAGRLARAGAQVKLAFTSGWEGGLFIMIARKPK
ncbi:MAG TPA: carbamoyltransferase C-terminal domain-containing protein, partial [Myxococcota bacterium]|nr:carbamoyltransferase C-terminal domain-containing protein [Myxococcota bacterium]